MKTTRIGKLTSYKFLMIALTTITISTVMTLTNVAHAINYTGVTSKGLWWQYPFQEYEIPCSSSDPEQVESCVTAGLANFPVFHFELVSNWSPTELYPCPVFNGGFPCNFAKYKPSWWGDTNILSYEIWFKCTAPSTALVTPGGLHVPNYCLGMGQPQRNTGCKINSGQQCGDPINTGVGNLFEEVTDYQNKSAFPLKVSRTYNSINPQPSAENMGNGWSTNIGQHLSINHGAPLTPCWEPNYPYKEYFCPDQSYSSDADPIEVTVWGADGSQTLFTYSDSKAADGTQLSPEQGSTGSLYFVDSLPGLVATAGFKYVRDNGDVEYFTGNGQLSSITSAVGLTHTYNYNLAGQLASISDTFGHQLTFSYDDNGNINTVETPSGLYTYSYDANKNLASVQFPDGSKIQYLYENQQYKNALTGIIDENGNRYATWSYDSAGRVNLSENGSGANKVSVWYNTDPSGIVTSAYVTEATGIGRLLEFKQVNFVSKLINVQSPCTTCGSKYKYITYDNNGYISSTTDFNGNVTQYVHDSSGLELSRTEGVGTQNARTIKTQWDVEFRKPTLITETGRTIAYVYDNAGRILNKIITDTATGVSETTAYGYNSDGLLISITDPLKNITHYSYNAEGNVQAITNALGQTATITKYDPNGNPLAIVNPNGVETDLVYDARQHLISRTTAGTTTQFAYDPTGNLLKVTLPTGAYFQYQYDDAHRLIGIVDNLGDRVSYILDALGNRVNEDVQDPAGNIARTLKRVYNNLNQLQQQIGGVGQTTAYTDDLNGNPTAITDPMGNVTHQIFDPLNRLVTVVDPENGNTTYNHDALDHITDVADPKGLDTHYTYDAFGDVLTQTSPDTGTTTYTYDLDGNRLTKTDANGVTTSYTYDALNRLTGITYPDSAENVTYSYDQGTNGIGRLTTIVDQSGSTAYQYDTHGNIVSKTSTVYGHTFAVAYQYDAADDLAGVTYPDGMQVTYVRDAAERITSVTATRNGVTQTLASGISYEPFGPLSGLTYGSGLTETRTYDQDYRLTSISVPGIEQWTVTDDANNDITGITDTLNSANSQTFGYDALNRLTSAQGFYGTLGYNYDFDGNRTALSTNGTTTAYSYDAASNRLLSTGTTSYQYDADGNLTSDGSHTYVYNDANRLTGYDSQAGVYLYNGLGQRVRKPSPVTPGDANGDGIIDQNDLHAIQAALKGQTPITPGMDCNQDGVVDNKDKSCIATQIGNTKNQGNGKNSTTSATAAATTGTGSLYIYFAYDEAGHLIGEYDQNGTPLEDHIWLGSRPLAVVTPNEIDYVTTDQLDTPRAITNQNKTLVWSWSSDPFGNGDANSNPSGQGLFTYNLRFPGQYYDHETGHNYNYFRDYDQLTGRYIESDPIGLAGGKNTYSYDQADPINKTDASGHSNYNYHYYNEVDAALGWPICDGQGNIIPHVDPTTSHCYADCVLTHEKVHVADLNKLGSGACTGKPRGVAVGFADDFDVDISEINAFKAEIKCLKKKLQSMHCDNNCKASVQRFLVEEKAALKNARLILDGHY